MFIEGKSKKFSADDLAHLIEIAGVEHTILSSDLGLLGSQRPVDGFRSITQMLLDLQMPHASIKKLISENAAAFLDLPAKRAAL
jgi:microsomal dipeptidase-like Zn-dependent dipeptidase